MRMVSIAPRCENLVELLDWCEMSGCVVLVLERPSPCIDLREFCTRINSPLSEPLARLVMRQVIQAARHCCDRQVLHRDIKPENLLINIDTLKVKLIDFGCGALLKDSPYTRFAGKRRIHIRTNTYENESKRTQLRNIVVTVDELSVVVFSPQELRYILLLSGFETGSTWGVRLPSGVWVCSCTTWSAETSPFRPLRK